MVKDPSNRIGDRYQEETKYHRDCMGGSLDWSIRPETLKQYVDRLGVVSLPDPQKEGGCPVWEVIRDRRSKRDFLEEPISRIHLSQLLWATQGITHIEFGNSFRACPSAGALYPIETYLAINRVDDVAPGIYHFYLPEYILETLSQGSFGRDLAKASLGQTMVNTASVVFIWTAVVQRSKWKYRERGYRYLYLDGGHIGQNLYLAATTLGLGCCTVGAPGRYQFRRKNLIKSMKSYFL